MLELQVGDEAPGHNLRLLYINHRQNLINTYKYEYFILLSAEYAQNVVDLYNYPLSIQCELLIPNW